MSFRKLHFNEVLFLLVIEVASSSVISFIISKTATAAQQYHLCAISAAVMKDACD